MKYGKIEFLDKAPSKIVLGTSSACFWKGQNCDDVLDAAYEAGVTTIDTARGYGKSEQVVGDWLNRRGLGEKVLVQSKGGLHGLLGNARINERAIRSDLEKSLKTLNTECIDLYFLHRDDERKSAEEIITLLNELKKEGKIKAFGASNWRAERIQRANDYAIQNGLQPFSASEPQYSLAEVEKWTWIGCTSVAGKENEGERAWYKETKMPLFAFSPLGGGFLSGRVKSEDPSSAKTLQNMYRKSYVSEANFERLKRCEEVAKELGATVGQIALSWVLCDEMNTFAIVGSTKGSSVRSAAQAVDIVLTKEQKKYLNLE